MPMITEGNRFVFFHEFEILLHENEDISHGSFHFCIPKANNALGYIYIFQECSRLHDFCLNTKNVQ